MTRMTSDGTPMMPYVCPVCKHTLMTAEDGYRCMSCERDYPIVCGTPDFRVYRDQVYGEPANEEQRLARLTRAYPTANSVDLYKVYTGVSDCTHNTKIDELRTRWQQYSLNIAGKTQKTESVYRWLTDTVYSRRTPDDLEQRGNALDIGCSFGGTLPGMSNLFGSVVGVDIDLASLIVARKLLEEVQITNVTLVAACAEALPFWDDSFHTVFAVDVIEHVQDQHRLLAETYRTLKPGATCVILSPNRLTIGKEPHVAVRGVGFVPRRWQAAYVQARTAGAIQYSGIRLLSYLDLRRLLCSVFRDNWTCQLFVFDPSVPPRTALGRVYRSVTAFRWLLNSFPMRLMSPLHIVAAWKEAVGQS